MKKLNTVLKGLLTIGLPLALAAYIFTGCATKGSEPVAPGTLTITGIPDEFNGKFFVSGQMVSGSKTAASGGSTVAKDGEVAMPVYAFKVLGKPNGYNGSDTLNVGLNIYDTMDEAKFPRSYDAIFESVQFSNGEAAVNWDDAIRAGYITITNIPEEYNAQAQVLIGQTVYTLVINSEIPNSSGPIQNGTVTVPVLRSIFETGNTSYTESGVKDILLSVKPQPSGNEITKDHQFLFRGVQITNGEATLNFSEGVRQ